MNNYYLTIVLKSDLEEAKRKTLLDSILKKMTADEGKVTKEDFWGNKDLAYPIKRQTKGYIAHFEVTSDPKIAKTIDKVLKEEDDILRYLLVRV